jgi:threonine dehydrogenase-like Zn-dependent dehydrogenase
VPGWRWEIFDVCFECTGNAGLAIASLEQAAPAGVCCLIGIPAERENTVIDLGRLYRQMLQRNELVIATVTANRRHFHEAHARLQAAGKNWLGDMITRRLAHPAVGRRARPGTRTRQDRAHLGHRLRPSPACARRHRHRGGHRR